MERLTSNNDDLSFLTQHLNTRTKFDDNKIKAIHKKLKEYEDLEEQGRLKRLPCDVGSTVYAAANGEIIESKVIEITLNDKGIRYIRLYSNDDRMADFRYEHFKKTVFFTQEEAERALKGAEECKVK